MFLSQYKEWGDDDKAVTTTTKLTMIKYNMLSSYMMWMDG